ncbi:MAG: hypothetical protein JJE25_06700 [Bacteroidia bacterium]|nr:hypothetical protein [Bacteroidia bacterium]
MVFPVLLYSQIKQDTTWKTRVNKVENKLEDIYKLNTENEREITNLKKELDFQEKLNVQTASSISNQLSAASYNLTLAGILLAIIGIILGVYVTIIQRKIVGLREENKELLQETQKVKKDVEDINELIQSDIYNLFLKIKRQETVHILDRLIKVPKDVANLGATLRSRDLLPDDFIKLRQACVNLGNAAIEYTEEYKILFFQHFFGQTLRDDLLRQDISKIISIGIIAAFDNDMVKVAADFSTVLLDKGIREFKLEINLFFEGLTKSAYKEFNDAYQTLFDNLKSRNNRFDLFDIIESSESKRIAKIAFGKILRDEYLKDNPTESEVLAFKELEKLIIDQEKDEVGVKVK